MSLHPDGTRWIPQDPGHMLERVEGFSAQLREAVQCAVNGPQLASGKRPSRILIAGMGGSAMGGDFVRQWAASRAPFAVTVVREDHLPVVDPKDTFAFFVSYSGNTDETLSSWQEACDCSLPRAVISSGGALLEKARAAGIPALEIPGGSPPRAALGWTSMPIFVALSRAGWIELPHNEFEELFAACDREIDDSRNRGPQFKLLQNWARASAHRWAMIYAPSDPLSPVATRWACQINENSKALAHVALLPEQNHNEIVGWEKPSSSRIHATVAVLRDPAASERTLFRLGYVAREISREGFSVFEFEPAEGGLLARLYALALRGDLASLHLAASRGVDPTPVAPIDRLKAELSSGKMVRSR